METLYLLRSPTNAKHLMEAIAEDQARKVVYFSRQVYASACGKLKL